MRWSMLKLWVTDEVRTQLTLLICAACGVLTSNVAPCSTESGAASICGRGPLNR